MARGRISLQDSNRIELEEEELRLKERSRELLQRINTLRRKHITLQRQGQNLSQDELRELNQAIRERETNIDQQVDIGNALDDIRERQQQIKNEIANSVKNTNNLDSALTSIGNVLSNQSMEYQLHTDRINTAKVALQSIGDQIKTNQNLTETDVQSAEKLANAIQEQTISLARVAELKAEGKDIEAAELARQTIENWESLSRTITFSQEGIRQFGPLLQSYNSEVQEANRLNNALLTKIQTMDDVMSEFSGIPGMTEFNKLLRTGTSDVIKLRAALFALGAVLAKKAWDYFGALQQEQIKAPFEAEIAGLNSQISIRENIIKLANLERSTSIDGLSEIAAADESIFKARFEAQNAQRRAALDFNTQLQQSAAQFTAAAKTALFGEQLGPVKFNTAQLQLAGISAEKIAEQIATAGDVIGKMPTAQIAEDMAILSTRTGASSEAIAQLTKSFMSTEGVSQQTALNLQEGFRAMAETANIPLNTLMQEVADASKEMIGYQIRSTSALASQVAYTKSIGVNFNEIAKAGRNMVLNYKDSIKSEMQLSAVLGRNVDLSEVRSKFASGDVKGAIQSLKAQGLNPEDMNMFEQEALSQALGGIDLASLRNIATGTSKEVGLKEGNVAVGNQAFLSRTQSAEAGLNAATAQISANQAVFSAQLEKSITQEYYAKLQKGFDDLANNIDSEAARFAAEYKKFNELKTSAENERLKLETDITKQIISDPEIQALKARINQLNQQMELVTGAFSAAAAVLGGLAFQLLPNILKGFKGFNVFGNRNTPRTAPSSGPPTSAPIGGRIGSMLRNTVNPNVLSKGVKLGGSALSGLLGGVSGFMEKKEEGGTTSEAVGAGIVQGGLAAGGAAIGAAFGGPLGMMIGGFLGDALGGWINDNAPGIAQKFGETWDSLVSTFNSLKEELAPIFNQVSEKISATFETVKNVFNSVTNSLNTFAKALGFEDGLSGVFSFVSNIIKTVLMTPINALIAAFGYVADVAKSLVQLFTGDVKGAFKTITTGVFDLIKNIFSPFEELFLKIKVGILGLWNSIANTAIGKAIGLEATDLSVEKARLKEFDDKRKAKIAEEKAAAEKVAPAGVAAAQKVVPAGVAAAQKVVPAGVAAAQNVAPVGVAAAPIPELIKLVEKNTLIESVLNVIKNNDHTRGIVTINEMKSEVINDNNNTTKTVKGLEKQTKDFIDNGIKQLYEIQNSYNAKSLNIQEAMTDLLAQLVQTAGVKPVIELDGKVLNKQIYNRGQNNRTIA